MKVSKIVVVLAIALALAALAVPASAWFGPFGPFGCGFGVPFGTVATSSFTATSTFSTVGGAGFGFSPFGLGFGGCGVPFGIGGCGFGTGFGSPFGFC